MIICGILAAFFIGFVFYKTKEEKSIISITMHRVLWITLASLLFIFSIFSSYFYEESGKEEALKMIGYEPYTTQELYDMSDREKDSLIKTHNLNGITYWRLSEQNTK